MYIHCVRARLRQWAATECAAVVTESSRADSIVLLWAN